MRPVSEMPGSLTIMKLDDRHYQLTDTSMPSIGLCLGVFPTVGAARSFADKLVQIRSRHPVGAVRRRPGLDDTQSAPTSVPQAVAAAQVSKPIVSQTLQ